MACRLLEIGVMLVHSWTSWCPSNFEGDKESLTGMDVARKVVILARECGLQLDLGDVEVESLVPEPLQSSPSAEAFLEGLPQVNSWNS